MLEIFSVFDFLIEPLFPLSKITAVTNGGTKTLFLLVTIVLNIITKITWNSLVDTEKHAAPHFVRD